MSYAEQLKHPKWQKRRLEMLSAAGFRCSRCYDGETTLHVHHKKYRASALPWEYSDKELEVLCETCHSEQHGRPSLDINHVRRLDDAWRLKHPADAAAFDAHKARAIAALLSHEPAA